MALDIDSMPGEDLYRFTNNVVGAWATRDTMLSNVKELRSQSWNVTIPQEWKIAVHTQHSSLPLDIASRVVGTLIQRDPTWSRLAPDELESSVEKANAVARYFEARHQHNKRHAAPADNAYRFLMDQMVNKGAAAVGVMFAPQAWANAPALHDESGEKIERRWWRDEAGKPAESEERMDVAASSRAWEKVVDSYRRWAAPPVEWRFVPTEWCYPVYAGRELHAMILKRTVTSLELSTCGFDPGELSGDNRFNLDQTHELVEVWTRNRARFLVRDKEVHYRGAKGKALEHNYGFVPWAYQTGIGGHTLEWGQQGLPLLALVEENLREIDKLLTYRLCAIQMAAFTSWYVRHKRERTPAEVAANSKPKSYKIKPGTVMDFGDDAEVAPFLHPGLNKDFDKAIEDERNEVRRIIPDVLLGIAESSGYNSAIMSQQARSIFTSILDGVELLLEQASIMEMRHVVERVPAPIYLEYAYPASGAEPRRMELVRLRKEDVADFYQIEVQTDREIDRITLGQHAAEMQAKGHFSRKWVHYQAGGRDFEASERQRRMEIYREMEPYKSFLMAEAARALGVEDEMEQQAAMQQIQMAPNGMPALALPNGQMVGPGLAPDMQGATGAMMGGFNGQSLGPNLASTNNPAIELSGGRGGRPPGAPQLQGMNKPEQR